MANRRAAVGRGAITLLADQSRAQPEVMRGDTAISRPAWWYRYRWRTDGEAEACWPATRMLGRTVALRLAIAPRASLFAPEVVDVAHEADVFLLNLECAISRPGPAVARSI